MRHHIEGRDARIVFCVFIWRGHAPVTAARRGHDRIVAGRADCGSHRPPLSVEHLTSEPQRLVGAVRWHRRCRKKRIADRLPKGGHYQSVLHLTTAPYQGMGCDPDEMLRRDSAVGHRSCANRDS